ncbi:MAG: preprotein translocase subunit YajC [Eubacterium sp.]|nr:preprotein translocase subunit YajC [Eubacterium sp.]
MFLLSVLSSADAGAGQATMGTGTGIGMLVFYIVFFVIMIYFIMVKPQKKQTQKHEEMMSHLKPGVSIMTTSGFFGTVIDIPDDETVIVEFGNNKNCRIPMHQKAIAEIEDPDSAVDDGDASEEVKEDKKEDKKSKK